jgi:hypothetical protein
MQMSKEELSALLVLAYRAPKTPAEILWLDSLRARMEKSISEQSQKKATSETPVVDG